MVSPTRPPSHLFCENPCLMAAFMHTRCSLLKFLPVTAGFWVSAVIGVSAAHAQEPVIQRIEAESLQPGAHATLAVHGSALKNAIRVWTPFGAFQPKAGHDPNSDPLVTLEADVPADTSPGIYPVRILTAVGCSAAAFVVVDDLPSHRPADGSEVKESAPAIPPACCLNGQVNPSKSRFFRLPLQAGQSVSIDVFARRLNSALDPAVRVTDPHGREVAFGDDVPGFDGDAQLRFTASEAGDYLLELRDVKFSGGPAHSYHLRVGDFPLIVATSPRIAVPASPIALLNADGSSAGEIPSAPVAANSVWTSAVWKAADSNASSISTLNQSHGGAQPEAEPNETQEQATPIAETSRFLTGRFQSPQDADWYRLSSTAPGPICLTAHTRDVLSPADVVLQLFAADGKKLAEADDTGALDAQLTTTLPAVGDYFLKVSELAGLAGAEWTYDIEIDRGAGRIEVTAPVDRVTVPRGGTASIVLTIKRINIDGPILLQADGLPAGLKAEPVWLGAKQVTAAFTLTSTDATTEAQPDAAGPLRIAASTPSNETLQPVPVLLEPRPVKPKAGDAFRTARTRADFFVAVGAPSQYSLTTEAATAQLAPGGTLTVPVKAVRTAEWTMPIELALSAPADQLPPGIKVDVAKIEGTDAVLTVTATAEATPGKFSVFAQGTSKKEKETVVQPVPVITIEVAAPAAAATETSKTEDAPKS